ncbi:MAG: hypothetical protein KMY53_01495 [Desulfarculus sp.]|nr:hypothetical protein [Desulfarculus sp.]
MTKVGQFTELMDNLVTELQSILQQNFYSLEDLNDVYDAVDDASFEIIQLVFSLEEDLRVLEG